MVEMNGTTTNICTNLKRAGVNGIPIYRQRLIANYTSDKFQDFLPEGRAALMFRQAGFRVTLREAPDLAETYSWKEGLMTIER
jgi:hypothetical protein